MPKLPFFKKKEDKFEEELKTGLQELLEESESLEDYQKIVELYKDAAEISEKKPKLSPDTIFNGVMGILGILLILNYEKLGIVTSKALKFVKFH